jgi:hypothetical protein
MKTGKVKRIVVILYESTNWLRLPDIHLFDELENRLHETNT